MGQLGLVGAGLTKQHAGLRRHNSGHMGVVGFVALDHTIWSSIINDCDSSILEGLSAWHPLRHVLVFCGDVAVNLDIAGDAQITVQPREAPRDPQRIVVRRASRGSSNLERGCVVNYRSATQAQDRSIYSERNELIVSDRGRRSSH